VSRHEDPTSRLLLVCDNRDDPNWGCRATSMALSQILVDGAAGSSAAITSRINRAQVTKPLGYAPSGLASAVLPERARWLLLRKVLPRTLPRAASPDVTPRRSSRFVSWASRGAVGGDFVSLDPEQTASTILRNRATHPHYASLCEAVEGADHVVVNGEGSLILRDPPRRDMLFQFGMLALARRLGRPSSYVNAMVSDPPVGGRAAGTADIARRALEACEQVVVRDPISFDVLGEIAPGLPRHVLPDALFSWAPRLADPDELIPRQADAIVPFPEDPANFGRYDFDTPYIAVSGGSLAAWDQPAAVTTYLRLVRALQRLGLPVLLVQTCTGDRFLSEVGAQTDLPVLPVRTAILQGAAVLAKARAFVSGRYHPSVLARLGGTPVVMMQGNSFKNEGLLRWVGPPGAEVFPAHPSDAEIDTMVERAAQAIAMSDDERREGIRRSLELGDLARTLPELLLR
jgi:hypothetical protein